MGSVSDPGLPRDPDTANRSVLSSTKEAAQHALDDSAMVDCSDLRLSTSRGSGSPAARLHDLTPTS